MSMLKAFATGLLLTALPALAHADEMSYRYFQLGYIDTEIDGLSENADGFATRGSIGFAGNFFLFTEVSEQEISVAGADLTIDQYAVGFGGHVGISDTVDIVGRAGWTRLDAEADESVGGSTSIDDDGYLVAVGLRSRIGEHVELEGAVIHQDFGGSAEDTGVELLARYYFSKRWALALEYQTSDDFSSLIAGVRVSF